MVTYSSEREGIFCFDILTGNSIENEINSDFLCKDM